jgi:uncharacterized protein YdeI (YjbR/CyaY-like superfamily)
VKTCRARTLEAWRRWLADHHDSESEVWLVFHKRHTGQRSIAYEDAVDEALCFGWIDSLVKRIDEACYARKFTPRKATSTWSDTNRRRYARLKAGGRMMPAGLCRPPTKRGHAAPAPSPTASSSVDDALRRHPDAGQMFAALAPSHRRQYLRWIESAKRPETTARRIAEAVRRLSAGETLGLK